jgi:hypothetical protein
VPAHVVDVLEAVQVDADQHAGPVAGARLAQRPQQAAPVGQPGQRVGVRQLAVVRLTLTQLERVALDVDQRQILPADQGQTLDRGGDERDRGHRAAGPRVEHRRADHRDHRDERVRRPALGDVVADLDRAVRRLDRPGHHQEPGRQQDRAGQHDQRPVPADAGGQRGRGQRHHRGAGRHPDGHPPGPVRLERQHRDQPDRHRGDRGRQQHRDAHPRRGRPEQVGGLGGQHPADEPDPGRDDQGVQQVPQRGARVLRRARQDQRAGQQGERAGRHRDGHRGAERLPVLVRRAVVHQEGAEQASQRRGGGDRPAQREQEVCPTGRAGMPSSGIAQQSDRRDRDHEAQQPGQLHAGR